MKKIFYIILFVLLTYTKIVYAKDFNLDIIPSKETLSKDDELILKLVANDLDETGLASGQFYIQYDKNYYNFSCENITYLQEIKSSEISCNDTQDKIILIYVDDDGGSSPILNGGFVNLKFIVKKDLDIKTTFNLNGEAFSGVDGEDILIHTIKNSVTKEINIEKIEDNNEDNNEDNDIDKYNDTYLKELSIDNYNINFKKDKYEYYIEVENNISTININAKPNDTTSKVTGTGRKNLNVGDNKFIIVVTALNGDKRNYIINVNRKENTVIDYNDYNDYNDNNINDNNEKSETIDNPSTGVKGLILSSFIGFIIVIFIVIKIHRKDYFPKI